MKNYILSLVGVNKNRVFNKNTISTFVLIALSAYSTRCLEHSIEKVLLSPFSLLLFEGFVSLHYQGRHMCMQ
jgi:hypothetical protein